MKTFSLTYGILPTKEQFDARYAATFAAEGKPVDSLFHFGNCSRMGDADLTSDQLWFELQKAVAEFEAGDTDPYEAGDWMSCVLGCIGIEWI